MPVNINITPFIIEIEERETFAVMRMGEKTTEVNIIFDLDHINKIAELLNFLYKVKLNNIEDEKKR